jgi:hypothetical protein
VSASLNNNWSIDLSQTAENKKQNSRIELVFAAANAALRGEITLDEWERLIDEEPESEDSH